MQFLGEVVELFRMKLSGVEIGGISCPELSFYSLRRGLGQPLGQLECTVDGTWQLEVPEKGGWPHVCLKGLPVFSL